MLETGPIFKPSLHYTHRKPSEADLKTFFSILNGAYDTYGHFTIQPYFIVGHGLLLLLFTKQKLLLLLSLTKENENTHILH